ncbi:hypothetical protein IGI04_027292 [Brassica rapa subsp. trilocularis]|uniref:Uncharacterized protein n=1 Tax=Brassica rapa subsp. trilocularis TaxID=1813537 RepID=A0ABQ7L197_BRACM|nr:hypothetical protein IGI04_027292 [Brassica rapa subsp. trilocularis]
MEKISMKLAFFIFIAISSVMSITETGANRLLQDEASQTVLLHHEASSQEAINPNKIHCKKGYDTKDGGGSSSDMRVVPPSKIEFPPYDGTTNAIEWSFDLMMTIFMIKECSMTMQK